MAGQRLEQIDQMAMFLQEPTRQLIAAIQRDLRLTMFVVHAWRSSAVQAALYQQGREYKREDGIWVVMNQDAVVTDAAPGLSPHNVVTMTGQPASVALDMVPMSVSTGQLLWNTTRSDWEKIWTLAWKFGLDPLGDSLGSYYPRDLCHFEEPYWQHKLAGLHLVRPMSLTQRV